MTSRARRRLLSASAIGLVLGGTGTARAEVPASAVVEPAAQERASPSQPSGAASVAPGAPALNPDEELVLEVRTADFIISDGMIGYASPRGVYLPLGELARLLDLAISVQGDARAEGWILSERRTFRLDLPTGEVEIEGKARRLSPGDAIAQDGEIFVRAPLLADWFPLGVQVSQATLLVRLETKERFPFEERAARENARARLGHGGGERTRFPREDTPYAFMSAPAFDVNSRATFDTGLSRSTSDFDIRAAGDLLGLNHDAFVGGGADKGLSSVRFTAGRRDPDRGLLGPLKLTDLQLGDTFSSTQPLGPRSRAGRGVFISSAPLDTPSVFDRIDLRGELPLGYEVELYRNDVLIGSAVRATDGRYEFPQVPLEFGNNVLRLVFYGPRGERREEVRQVRVGDGRLGRGAFRFSAGVVQEDVALFDIEEQDQGEFGLARPDRGQWQTAAFAEYGLSPYATLAAGLASFSVEGERRHQALAGVRTAFADTALQLDLALQNEGAYAVQTGLAGRRFGVSYVLQHVEYGNGFADETRVGAGREYSRASVGRFDWTVEAAERPVGFSLAAQRTQTADGDVQLNAALRASTTFGPYLVSNVLNANRNSGRGVTRQGLEGALDVSGAVGNYGLRAGLSYALGPEAAFRDVNFTVDRQFGETLVRTGVTQQLTRDRDSRFVVSVARLFRTFDVSLDAQYDTSDSSILLGARVGFSLGWNAAREGYALSRPGLARGGSVLVSAFRDVDADGRRDPGEPPVDGLKFRSGGAEAVTDKGGVVLLSGVGEGRAVGVELSAGSLGDPYLSPVRNGLEFVPRPGRTHIADFPIVTVSDVEGEALFAGGTGARPVANVALQLVDGKGEVVGRARTEHDGYFLFERVPPGAYSVRLDPEQAQRLSVRLDGEAKIETEAEGGLVDGVKIKVVSTRSQG